MSKNTKLTPIRRVTNHLVDAMSKAAEASFRNTVQDNSPKLDALILRDTMETVSALNLGDLAVELYSLTRELPLFAEHSVGLPAWVPGSANSLAVAFESGRRYMLLQACQILSEECGILPTEAMGSGDVPLMEA